MNQLKKLSATVCATAAIVAGLTVGSALAQEIYSENFDDWDGTTDVVSFPPDGIITATTWPQTDFTLSGSVNLMRPAVGSAWLDPVPAELGTTFALLHSGVTATVDLTDVFADNTTYTLTFDNFRRDDLVGDEITAQIMTTSGIVLATDTFAAVPTTGTIVERSVSFMTDGGIEVGQNIRLQFIDPNGNNILNQSGIDNIVLNAETVPEPASVAIWGLLGLGLVGFGVYRARRMR